jgi:hypothetical protein
MKYPLHKLLRNVGERNHKLRKWERNRKKKKNTNKMEVVEHVRVASTILSLRSLQATIVREMLREMGAHKGQQARQGEKQTIFMNAFCIWFDIINASVFFFLAFLLSILTTNA